MRIGVDLAVRRSEILPSATRHRAIRQRIPTPAGGYRDTVAAVVTGAERRQALGGQGQRGGGHAGCNFARQRIDQNASSTCLNGHALDRDLSGCARADGACRQ